jgi:RNA polymerase sigma-54 factor
MQPGGCGIAVVAMRVVIGGQLAHGGQTWRQLATDTGGACSAASVRALLKEMIEAEDADAPLSDVSLAKMLAEQGVIVARRTVAKYRGLMRIAPAEMRRQV